ncbi:NUDIX hydrolase [Nocardioides bruguierae]|uniref:NUDIX hydrolase n=1 Tax=Nocardioides bruguierae TaxID=2945102 RepID=UPI00201FC2C1|nr:NUDIX hydrolase [Nocardioides bruguierae]MCL8024902.1 NUDIX hydrolase [Nocardioides bruguierae]
MSLHDDALARLEAWSAPSTEQERLRERYVAHLRTHPDACDRSCRPDHLTASTLVLSPGGGHVLLTLHAKARQWFQLGGHCEPGDTTLAAAALREATEESGLGELELDPVPVQLSEHAVPFCGTPTAPGERPVHHLDVRFLAVVRGEADAVVSDESLDVRWWPADELPDPQPDMVELVDLARARLRA